MGFFADKAEITKDDIPKELDADFGETRTAKHVIQEMLGWFDWFYQLNTEINWFEVPPEDFDLLSHMPSFSPVFTGKGEHKVARYTFHRVREDSFNGDVLEVMIVGDAKSTSIAAHPQGDPM